MAQPASREAIGGEIIAIIAKQANLDAGTITPASTLKDLGVTSLDAIEVIFDIEEHFDINFPDEGPNFDQDTVQRLIDAVVDAIAAKAAGAEGGA
ncbi:phosphopantetheine-binding protein [Frateuria defendens]|uniref:phosphopantetheine-binding protein n=1 Tax=Frateuria defendens TaxID=2219559 RepID=UPI00066FE086|nr:phosphopantetheine-binding protein [Frateuria defendens]